MAENVAVCARGRDEKCRGSVTITLLINLDHIGAGLCEIQFSSPPIYANMHLTLPPVRSLIVDHGPAEHWHVLAASDRKRDVTTGDLHASVKAFGSSSRKGLREDWRRWFRACAEIIVGEANRGVFGGSDR